MIKEQKNAALEVKKINQVNRGCNRRIYKHLKLNLKGSIYWSRNIC